jgi:hypothetical protein
VCNTIDAESVEAKRAVDVGESKSDGTRDDEIQRGVLVDASIYRYRDWHSCGIWCPTYLLVGSAKGWDLE